MSESRVRENCMHGLTGGRWPTSHGEPDRAPEGKPDGLSPVTYSLESQRPTSPETYLEHRERGSQAPDLVIWPPATYRG
jgi:hypothetical protein